jgi:hypothetical protein
MKKIIARHTLVFLMTCAVTIGVSCPLLAKEGLAVGPAPVVTVGTPLVKMTESDKIILMGTGFQPGQEICLHLVTADGQQADITYALKPTPKADKTGTWATTWNASDYVKTKLVTGGAYKISVTDSDLRAIAQTPIFFLADQDTHDKGKK